MNIRDWIIELIGKGIIGLKLAAATIVGRVLATFGLSAISVQAILPDLKTFVQGFVTGLPAPLVQLFGAVGADIAMSMILSALTVKMAWKVFIVPTAVANQIPGGGA